MSSALPGDQCRKQPWQKLLGSAFTEESLPLPRHREPYRFLHRKMRLGTREHENARIEVRADLATQHSDGTPGVALDARVLQRPGDAALQMQDKSQSLDKMCDDLAAPARWVCRPVRWQHRQIDSGNA